eukprot:Awhi_evm1s4752
MENIIERGKQKFEPLTFPDNCELMSTIVWATKPHSREITVSKNEFTKFGATFCSLQNRIYVVHSDDYFSEDKKEKNKESTAAHKSGIRWGDELIRINGNEVHTMHDIYGIYATLTTASRVTLEMVDQPNVRIVRVVKANEIDDDELLGVEIKNGKIFSVEKGSPSEKAGLKPDTSIIAIGDNEKAWVIFGDESLDEEIEKAIVKSWKKYGEVVFTTAIPEWTSEMFQVTQKFVELKFKNTSMTKVFSTCLPKKGTPGSAGVTGETIYLK